MRCKIAPVLLLLLMAEGCSSIAARDPRPGDVLYVSCYRALPLHAAPSAFSETLGTLNYGSLVRIVSVEGAGAPQRDNVPKWARVEAGVRVGYLPLSSLVSRRLIEQQGKKSSSIESQADSGGLRGFSEEEKPDLVAMKGAAGSARSGESLSCCLRPRGIQLLPQRALRSAQQWRVRQLLARSCIRSARSGQSRHSAAASAGPRAG